VRVATTTTAAGTRTIARLWQDAVERRWPGPAYLVQEGEDWREVSWDEAAQAVEELANGLLALGIRKGDAFSILGSTRLEWVLFDFALGLVGAVGAPIYMNSSPKDTHTAASTRRRAAGWMKTSRSGASWKGSSWTTS